MKTRQSTYLDLSKWVVLTLGLYASFVTIGANSQQSNPQLLVHSDKSVHFFEKQVENTGSPVRALTSLIQRFPQQTADFLSIALTQYPSDYKQLIKTSVSTNPMFVDEILLIANEHKIALPTEIVEIAISAEPSYASVTTSSACELSPEKFNEIIRAAVNLEPDSADQIAKKLVTRFPTKSMEILTTTLKEVPYVGKYVLDALLTTTEEKQQTENLIIVTVEQLAQYPDAIERLVELAKHHDIESNRIKESALKGGLKEEQIVSILTKYY